MKSQSLAKMLSPLYRHAEWNIGIVNAPIITFLDSTARPSITWLPPPRRGTFLADPFAVRSNGTVYILCEEFDYSTNRKRIVSIELKNSSISSGPSVAIPLPVPASYPYLLKHEGHIYCVPETNQARETNIYKAKELPNKWIKVATLISNFPALDTTIFNHEGRWWLTCTREDSSDHSIGNQELHIWYAQDLLGPWKSHSGNPVKIDARSSRPAGTPFTHDGNLYRPTQDCSNNYGSRIVINRVTKLTQTEFEEQEAATFGPYSNEPFPDGVHTVSAVGNITVTDGLRYRFLPSALRGNLKQVLGR